MAKNQDYKCSFCGRSKNEAQILIAGISGHICENCVSQAQQIIDEELFQKKEQSFKFSLPKSLKPIVRRETAVIAELDGEPVAMAVSLPNVNEAIADLNGRLLPLGWLKLLWRLKVKTPKSTRLPLMGIRRKYHGTPLGAGLAYAVIEAVRGGQQRLGVERGELSWILEDNLAMRRMIEQMGGVAYKTYRLYEQALS